MVYRAEQTKRTCKRRSSTQGGDRESNRTTHVTGKKSGTTNRTSTTSGRNSTMDKGGAKPVRCGEREVQFERELYGRHTGV